MKKAIENKTSLDYLSSYQTIGIDQSLNQSVMKKFYDEVLISEMKNIHGYKNIMQIPKLSKIVLNVGFGIERKNDVDYVFNKMKLICGQLPKLTKAKKSISNFKIRAGDTVGCMVTLRSARMYNFLEKLLFVHLSRMQNFLGFSTNGFDGMGNFSFGISKHSIFLESKDYKADFDFGFDVTVVTSAKNNEEAVTLLKLFGFPFK